MNERLIPNNSQLNVVTYHILIDGAEIPATTQILTISVTKEVNRIPTALLIIKDGDPALETFQESESAYFILGKKIEIKGGHDGHDDILFKGIIVRHAIKVHERQGASLTIECKDESVKMTIGRKNKYFEDVKDSDAIETILSAYNLKGDIDATDVQHPELVQHHVTDWDFIVMRAEVNGKIVIVNDGKVNLKAPTYETPILSLQYGATLLEFEAEMDARHEWQEVKTSAWKYSTQEVESFDTTRADFREHGNISGANIAKDIAPPQYELRHSGQLSAPEAQAWTKAAMLKSRMAKIRGRAKFEGFGGIKPGKWVKLGGVGNRFNGDAYVSAVRHELRDGAWFTHAQFGMSPEWFAAKPQIFDFPTGGLIPPVSGLQIGKVVKLENDPMGEDRIQIKLPTLNNESQGIWARVACLDAGNNRGSFFRPEIDDEVIVGFINDDPRDAIVLGQLNSQAKPAPVQGVKDTNHIKGFYTRSEMQIEFDDEKKIMTFKTPAGNSIVLSEDEKSITLKDQNDNKITMNADGIEISSPKDIVLKAIGKINIKATKDAELEGLNTTVKASANLSVQGQAGLSLNSSGVSQLKGSIVQIN
jgi:Rhs element Vgr protein